MGVVVRRIRRANGTLGELEKVFNGETPGEKIERIESDNAMLIYGDMMKDSRIDDLVEQLTKKGVL